MKNIDDNKIIRVLKKILLNLFSPTYGLYNSMKINVSSLEKKDVRFYKKEVDNRKKYNEYLANNTKYFFLALSLFIVSIISVYDYSYIVSENNVYKFLYIIIAILLPFSVFNYFIFKIKKVNIKFKMLPREEKKYNRAKLIYNKKIILIFYIVLLVYYLIQVKEIYIIKNIKSVHNILFILTLYVFAISRPIHFFSIFIPDIKKKLTKRESRDGEGKFRLILIAIGSIANIVIDYAILFYMLNSIGLDIIGIENIFSNEINGIVDMIYFTGGFSSTEASSFITKILVMIKDISIFILLTGNLAIYMSIGDKYKRSRISKKNRRYIK